MLDLIASVNGKVNAFVWGVPAMICIMGVGIYLTIGTRFLQFRKLGVAFKHALGKLFTKEKAGDGAITPFQALCTALSATVGTGNIAGVAGAIALGGPGAVFWMWISALLGMCTKFSEVTLALTYREKNSKGDWVGGPMYYIKNGLSKNWKWLAGLYAIFGALTVFGTGNATQVNTIVTALNAALVNYKIVGSNADGTVSGTVLLIEGIAIALLVALVVLGGIKRIGSFTEKLVPFMAVLYIVLGIGVIIINIDRVPGVFADIFEGAFAPKSVTGGVVGSMFVAMRRGVSRGIFSNEAGLGTGSIAHATSSTKEPCEQGLFGIFEVFTDTIIICTLTAMIILCSGVDFEFGKAAGAELTISGLTTTYGNWVSLFTAIALICFAFSTTIGWGLYGSRCMEYLFGTKIIKPFLIVYSLVAILGATVDLGLVWGIADTFNGLMAIPNLIGVFLLAKVVFKKQHEYFDNPQAEDK